MRRIFGLLKLNKNEFRKFAEEDRQYTNGQFPLFNFLSWYNSEIKLKNDYEIEKMKFQANQEPDFFYIKIAAIAGTFLGCTLQIISEKMKEDDIQVREKGYVDYYDIDFINLMIRRTKAHMHMFVQRNILINFKDLKPNLDVSVDDFDMAKYKQHILRLDQVQYYQKHRDHTFDFVYFAEKENLLQNA